MIKKCTFALTDRCKSEYQDEKYGRGQRVHNKTKDEDYPYRCTVCGTERKK